MILSLCPRGGFLPLREESEEISNFFQILLDFAPCFKKGKIGGTENDSVNPSYVDSYAGLKSLPPDNVAVREHAGTFHSNTQR